MNKYFSVLTLCACQFVLNSSYSAGLSRPVADAASAQQESTAQNGVSSRDTRPQRRYTKPQKGVPARLGYVEELIQGGVLFVPREIASLQWKNSSCNFVINSVEFDPGCILASIGKGVFKEQNIQTAILPDKVISIDSQAFAGCKRLETIRLPNGIKFIGSEAFAACETLERFGPGVDIGQDETTLPSSLTRIDAGAFKGCQKLRNITIPNRVEFIGEGAFKGCTSLHTVVLGQNVNKIQSDAFSSTGVTSIVIPSAVSYIGSCVFKNSPLETMTFEARRPDMELHLCSEMLDGTNVKEIVLSGIVVFDRGVFASTVIEYLDLSQCSRIDTFFESEVPTKRQYLNKRNDASVIQCLNGIFSTSDNNTAKTTNIIPVCRVKFAEGNVWQYNSEKLSWERCPPAP
ncbi:MAG: leucine-rich repeat domain-containing protein [Holosporales bacterium]|jgi:hypothetical protein|nr:leucine-rich repeat domain-containing protein [Holosporales bacterium]